MQSGFWKSRKYCILLLCYAVINGSEVQTQQQITRHARTESTMTLTSNRKGTYVWAQGIVADWMNWTLFFFFTGMLLSHVLPINPAEEEGKESLTY